MKLMHMEVQAERRRPLHCHPQAASAIQDLLLHIYISILHIAYTVYIYIARICI